MTESKDKSVEPKVTFNAASGLLKLEGRSTMRDALEFYQPIIDQLTKTTVPTYIIEIKLEHFNTGTARCLYKILQAVDEKKNMGAMILIRWFSDEGDEDHKELGEDLEAKVGLPFQYVDNK